MRALITRNNVWLGIVIAALGIPAPIAWDLLKPASDSTSSNSTVIRTGNITAPVTNTTYINSPQNERDSMLIHENRVLLERIDSRAEKRVAMERDLAVINDKVAYLESSYAKTLASIEGNRKNNVELEGQTHEKATEGAFKEPSVQQKRIHLPPPTSITATANKEDKLSPSELARIKLSSLVFVSERSEEGTARKLEQMLELLQRMRTDQKALEAEIDDLKPDEMGEQSLTPTSDAQLGKTIKRENGFITSVHPALRGKAQAAIARVMVGGFPMSHSIGKEDFGMKNKEISYNSTGELQIHETGVHSLQVGIEAKYIGSCKFRFELAGESIFDIPKIYHSSGIFSSEVELEEGFYKFKMFQYCSNPSVTWNMKILSPSSMNPVTLTSEYFHHRVK